MEYRISSWGCKRQNAKAPERLFTHFELRHAVYSFCEAKISDFYDGPLASLEEDVLWLQIPMRNPALVDVLYVSGFYRFKDSLATRRNSHSPTWRHIVGT